MTASRTPILEAEATQASRTDGHTPGVGQAGLSSRGRRWLLAIGLVTLSGLLSLGALEAGIRLLDPQPTKISVPAILDSELIYQLPGDARGTDVKAEFAVTIETNALGLRDRDYPPDKPKPVQTRILVLGDSMTFGEGVEADESYPKVLEAALGGRYEVINAATRGYGTDQQLILFDQLVPVYRPDVVLLAVYPFNDFDDIVYGQLFEVREGRLTRVPITEKSSPKYRYYRRQSFIQTFPGYRAAIEHSHLVNYLRIRWAGLEYQRAFPSARIDPATEEQAWQLMRPILVAWEERARGQGIQPVILLIPSLGQIQMVDERTNRRMQRVLEHARTRGLPVIDPRGALHAAIQAEVPVFYPLASRLTPAGHRVMADHLRSRLHTFGIVSME